MYKLMWKDTVIAEFFKGKNPFESKMIALPDVPQHYLPFGLFGRDKREVSLTEFIEWGSDRCFPEERIGAKELLEQLGLDRYDKWSIVEKTNGVLGQDHYWIDFGNGKNY